MTGLHFAWQFTDQGWRRLAWFLVFAAMGAGLIWLAP